MTVFNDPLIASNIEQHGSGELRQFLELQRTPGLLKNQAGQLLTLLDKTTEQNEVIALDPRLTQEGKKQDCVALGVRAVKEARTITEKLIDVNVTRHRNSKMSQVNLRQSRPDQAAAARAEFLSALDVMQADDEEFLTRRITTVQELHDEGISPAEVLLHAIAREPDIDTLMSIAAGGRWWRELHGIRQTSFESALSTAARRNNPEQADNLDRLDELERILTSNLREFVLILANAMGLSREVIDSTTADIIFV